jgi:squalene-associated FAD-dependent desaturase
MGTRRIAVIGGGLAGITAALRAADRGAEVVLVERRARLGGLTWSFRRRGLWFDNGQHVFLRCCTAYRQLLDRLGAADQVVIQRRLSVPVLSPCGVSSRIARSSLPAPLHLVASLGRYRHLSLGDRARLGRAALALRRLDPEDPALDAVSFARWLAQNGQREAAITRLWDLIVLPTLNVPSSEASLRLAVKVFRDGLLDANDAGDIGWSIVPLGELHGANAARALERAGVEIVHGVAVRSVERNADGGFAVRTVGPLIDADGVIVATGPPTARAIAGDAVPSGVLGLGDSPIVNVHLVLDRRVTDLPMAASVGSPVQFVFDRTQSSGLTAGQYLAVSLSAADRYLGSPPDALVRSFHQAVGDLFPAARRARLVDGTVTRERHATFRARTGTAALRPPARTAVPGLYLAGAWCDTGWPATMEGAVRSGLAAADGALEEVRAA